MNHSESIKEIATALSKAQGVMEGAKKDSENPHFKSKYADLAAVWEACRKPLSDNGLSVVQFIEGGPDILTVITRLMHDSGEFLESSLTIKPVALTPQGLGSAATYGRRYSLMALVGIAADDDDGNAASQAPQTVKPQQQRAQQQQQAPAQEQKQAATLNLITDSKKKALELAGEINAIQQEYGLTQEEIQRIGAVSSIKELVRDEDLHKLQDVLNRLDFYVKEQAHSFDGASA